MSDDAIFFGMGMLAGLMIGGLLYALVMVLDGRRLDRDRTHDGGGTS